MIELYYFSAFNIINFSFFGSNCRFTSYPSPNKCSYIISKNLSQSFQEDMKSLINYVVEDYMPSFESVDYVQTFKGLKMRYDQERDRQNRKNMDR